MSLILAGVFWWFALLDAEGRTVQVIGRFETASDCEFGRTFYVAMIEASGRTDRTAGVCQMRES